MKHEELPIPTNRISNEAVLGISNPYTVSVEGRRLVVIGLFDIDGTSNRQEKPENERLTTIGPAREAVHYFFEHGVVSGACTGRSYAETLKYADALGERGITICEDGAVLILSPNADEQTTNALQQEGFTVVEHAGRKSVILSQITTPDIAALVRDFESENPYTPGQTIVSTTYSTPEEIQAHPELRHATIEAAEESADRLASAYLSGLNPSQDAKLAKMAEARGMRTFVKPLHIIGADADKAKAAEALSKIIHILLPQYDGVYIIGIGNGSNDIPLLRSADIPVLVAAPGDELSYAIDPSVSLPSGIIKTTQPAGDGMLEAIPTVFSRLEQIAS